MLRYNLGNNVIKKVTLNGNSSIYKNRHRIKKYGTQDGRKMNEKSQKEMKKRSEI
jgi:hypothetical protein